MGMCWIVPFKLSSTVWKPDEICAVPKFYVIGWCFLQSVHQTFAQLLRLVRTKGMLFLYDLVQVSLSNCKAKCR